jgi:hypothetical protein
MKTGLTPAFPRRTGNAARALRPRTGGGDSVGAHIMHRQDRAGELSRSTRWIAAYRAWGNAETPFRFPVGTVEPDPARHFLVLPFYSPARGPILLGRTWSSSSLRRIVARPSGSPPA